MKFDPGKEKICIISRAYPHGDDFELLGVLFDCKLVMENAVQSIATKANAKLRALLRARRHMSIPDAMVQFKAHILCLLEYPTPAVYHASDSVLAALDRVQARFLRELGLSEKAAFLDFALCPLQCRRDIAMLGLLHKVSLGLAHEGFRALFPPAAQHSHGRLTRANVSRHNKQILDRCDGGQSQVLHRSIFGLVPIYNSLPQACIDLPSVSRFQSFLTRRVKLACESNQTDWSSMFSARGRIVARRGF